MNNPVTHLLLTFTEGIADLFLVVAELRRELATDGAKPSEVVGIRKGGCGLCFHGSISVSRCSYGVITAGMPKPSFSFTRQICSFLFALPERGDGQVSRITIVIRRHDLVGDVAIHHIVDLRRGLQQPKLLHEIQTLGVLWFRRFFEFPNHPERGYKLILPLCQFPPFTCPEAAGLNRRLGPGFKVETRDASHRRR